MFPQRPTTQKNLSDILTPNEEILASARIHWGIYWPSVAVTVMAFLFTLFIARELGFFLALVSLVMALHALVQQNILMLVVTNKRFLARTGILQIDAIDLPFDKVESFQTLRMPTAYLMGYAGITLTGTGNRLIQIPYIANAAELRAAYNSCALKS